MYNYSLYTSNDWLGTIEISNTISINQKITLLDKKKKKWKRYIVQDIEHVISYTHYNEKWNDTVNLHLVETKLID